MRSCITRWLIKGPLTHKIFFGKWSSTMSKTSGDTKSCYTYMQIGKDLQLRCPESQPFSCCHKGNGSASGTYCKCYTRPLFQLRNACISSLVPCRNIGLLLRRKGKWSRSTGFAWLVQRNGNQRRVRGTARTVQASVCCIQRCEWLSTWTTVSSAYRDKVDQ